MQLANSPSKVTLVWVVSEKPELVHVARTDFLDMGALYKLWQTCLCRTANYRQSFTYGPAAGNGAHGGVGA